MSDIEESLRATVNKIADHLKAAANGELYLVEGEYEKIEYLEGWKEDKQKEKEEEFRKLHPEDKFNKEETGCDTYEEWMNEEIGGLEGGIEYLEEVSMSDYLERESLGDIRFEVDTDKEIHGGRILVGYGGPNIWITEDEVQGYWGSTTVKVMLDSNTRSAIMEYLGEMWDAIKQSSRRH